MTNNNCQINHKAKSANNRLILILTCYDQLKNNSNLLQSTKNDSDLLQSTKKRF